MLKGQLADRILLQLLSCLTSTALLYTDLRPLSWLFRLIACSDIATCTQTRPDTLTHSWCHSLLARTIYSLELSFRTVEYPHFTRMPSQHTQCPCITTHLRVIRLAHDCCHLVPYHAVHSFGLASFVLDKALRPKALRPQHSDL